MIIKSNPFLRNDYYPDQNDIDQLNQRIDEAENETSLVNIRLTADIENVSNNLNSYKNEMADTVVTNNIIVNNLNANYAVGKYANFANTNTDNAYIENLTVNKPVFDITLNTPHLENTTSLNGNFYAPNILGGVFDSIQIENMQNFKAVNIEASEIKTNTVDLNVLNAVNIKADEVKANTLDLNAVTANIADLKDLNAVNIRVDEVIANRADFNAVKVNIADFNVLNAMNIEAGEVKANIADFNEVTANIANLKDLNATNAKVDKVTANTIDLNVLNAVNIEADKVKANKLIGDFFSAEPISSSAVVGYDENGQLIPIRASYDVSFPESADYLKTDAQGVARKGTSESEVVQSTNLIQAGAVKNMYDAVNESFSDVNNTFNIVNNTFNIVNENLNNVKSSVRKVNNFIFNGIYLPEYGSFNSHSPVQYAMARHVEFYGNAQGGTALPDGGGLIKFDSSTNTVTFGFSGAACKGIINAYSMFAQCTRLNQSILIPSSVEKADSMFYSCSALNQNILIPNSVVITRSMFFGCSMLNQNILIPSSVVNAQRMFFGCSMLNQDIYIYSQVLNDMSEMFLGTKVNKHNVHIPSSVPKDTSNYIYNCLVNNATGVKFAPENIFNDLPVDTEQWPPV